MQGRSPEEYRLMVAWTHILIDGFNSLLESFGGAAGDAINKSGIKDAAKKAGINLPDVALPRRQEREERPSPPVVESGINSRANEYQSLMAGNNVAPENISTDTSNKPEPKNFSRFKDPRVLKATTSVESEWRMKQYEKLGVLDECFRQRDERIAEDEARRKAKGGR